MVHNVLVDMYNRNRLMGKIAKIPALLKEYEGRELRLLRLSHEKYEPEGEHAKLGVTPDEEAQQNAWQQQQDAKTHVKNTLLRERMLKEVVKASQGVHPDTLEDISTIREEVDQ